MAEGPLIVGIGAGLLLGLILFINAKIFQDRHRISRPVLFTLLGAAGCLIIWLSVVVPRTGYDHLHLWQRLVAAGCAPYAVLLYYAGLKQMFGPKCSWSLTRSKAFWITNLLIGIIIVLDICQGEQAPVFDSTESYPHTWMFYTESALSYSTLLCLDLLIVRVYYESLQRCTNLLNQSRLGSGMLAFLVNLLGLALVDAALLLALCGYEQYRLLFNSIYHVSLLVTAILLACGYVPPDRWFLTIMRPLASSRASRHARRQALLRQLHQAMVTIVPGVQLSCEQIHDLRVLIEISDARQVIWSQQPRMRPLTPWDEARHLQNLLSTSKVLIAPGAYIPVPTRLKDTVKHNVMVAKQLRRLQKAKQVKAPGTYPRQKQSWIKRALTAIGALLSIACLVLSMLTWYLCDRLMYPQRIPITHIPTIPYETVQLETSDHVSIRGWFIPASVNRGKAPALLLLHGVSDNRTVFARNCPVIETKNVCPFSSPTHSPPSRGTYPTMIDALHYNGYALLIIDQRAQGESGETICTYGLNETRDVAAALSYLQARPDVDQTKLGIYGTSMGSMTAIHAAAQMPAFRAIAVESPFADLETTLQMVTAPLIRLPGWMVKPLLALYYLRTGVDLSKMRNIDDMAALGNRPFYAIGDMKDAVTIPGDARALYNASHASLRELWEVSDAGHTESRFLHPDEFDQRLITFFNTALQTR